MSMIMSRYAHITIAECENLGHPFSPEIAEDGQVVLDPADGLPRDDGLPHEPGQVVRVCPRCLLVQIVVYGEDGRAEFTWYDYESALRNQQVKRG